MRLRAKKALPDKPKYPFLLRRMIVCAECGWTLGAKLYVDRTGTKLYPYYKCSNPEQDRS